MDFYIYILYSDSSDRYYVGSSDDPWQRLDSHNKSGRNTYTSKHRPWKLVAVFLAGQNRADAVNIENWIKRQKSRKLLEKAADPKVELNGILAQLVRVPYLRD